MNICLHAIFSYHFVLHLIFTSPPYLDQALSPPGQESLHTDFGWTLKIGMTLKLTSVIMFESRNQDWTWWKAKAKDHLLLVELKLRLLELGLGLKPGLFLPQWWQKTTTTKQMKPFTVGRTLWAPWALSPWALSSTYHLWPTCHLQLFPKPIYINQYKLSENEFHVIKASRTICILLWC